MKEEQASSRNGIRHIRTRKTLIQRLQDDPDDSSWHEFYQAYRGFVFALGKRFGLEDRDAEELVNDVFAEVHRNFLDDPELSFHDQSFGGWLANKARWRARDRFRRNKANGQPLPEVDLEHLETEKPFERLWKVEWERELLATALNRLEESPKNCLVFIDLAIRETPVNVVCKRYGISRGNADTIKYRVRKKLKPIIEELRTGMI